MSYIPITPFRRSISAELIEHQKFSVTNQSPNPVDKYQVVRELTSARQEFNLSDRTLGVLQALLSFYPKRILDETESPLLVYPSNAAICERLNGMPCSTMRRHVSKLVDTGLILRRDSPNGKRYIKRYGDTPQSFGFDLTPLLTRYTEICELAAATLASEEKRHRLRRTVSLMRRDLASLVEYGAQTRPELAVWDWMQDVAKLTARDLRRNLTIEELTQLELNLDKALTHAKKLFDLEETTFVSTKDAENEQLIHNSNKEYNNQNKNIEDRTDLDQSRCRLPLKMVTETLKELQVYAPNGIRNWTELIKTADNIRPMMGIETSVWNEAIKVMGIEETAVVVLGMLERFQEIRNPGGYLRSLSRRANEGRFSSGAMIMALVNSRVTKFTVVNHIQ